MNMQQLMMQAQKMQRELKKAKDELGKKEFTLSKGGAVSVTMRGDKTILSIDIKEDAFTPDFKEDVQDMLALTINELIKEIEKAEEEINSTITGQTGGFGF